MRKEILFAIIMMTIVAIVLIFMAQNTRFESNSLACSHPKNFFEVNYSKLKNGAPLSFQKNDNTLEEYTIRNFKGSTFEFNDQNSRYQLDLLDDFAIETRADEVLLYQCEHKKFKM